MGGPAASRDLLALERGCLARPALAAPALAAAGKLALACDDGDAAQRLLTASVEPEVVWGVTAAWGLGYLLGGPEPDAFAGDVGRRHSAFGHPGIGGASGSPTPSTGWPWAS